MLSIWPSIEVFRCALPTDMRRGFGGLMRMAEEHLQRNEIQGGLFVFVNRRRDRVSLLYWDQDAGGRAAAATHHYARLLERVAARYLASPQPAGGQKTGGVT